ncbi:copper amine oxidase, partial [Bacillus sp. TL12]|nr:copper amine oxidase [Bacillus sp. TL12]
MKKLKVVSSLTLGLSLFIPALSPAQAATKLTYTQTGANYMYSNSPETVKGPGAGYEHRFESGKYSYYTLQRYTEPGKEYVAEFYNHNNAGMDLQWGYAIYNGSSSTRYVTIKNDSIKYGPQSLDGNSMVVAS